MMRRLTTVTLPVILLTATGPAALAGWGSMGDAEGSVTATGVNAGNPPAPTRVVTSPTQGSVGLSWSASTLVNGEPVTHYDVVRTSGTTSTTVCPGEQTTSCSDTAPLPGPVTYAVVPRIGAHWTGPQSAGAPFQFDVYAPTTSIQREPSEPASGWHDDAVHVTLTASDPGPVASGVREIHYSVNGGTPVVVDGPVAELDVTEENENNIAFWAVDNLGNTESPSGTGTVKIDTTPPVSSGRLDGAEATLTAADNPGGSGLDRIEYRIGAGGAYSTYTGVVTLSDGQTVYFRAVDVAGNVETPDKSLSYTAPADVATTTTVESSRNPAKSGETVTFTATVGAASGTPTGTVSFMDGGSPISCSGGSQTLSGGQATCQVSFPSMSTRTITASYPGQGAYVSSSSAPLTQRVVAAAVTGLSFTEVTVDGDPRACPGAGASTYTCSVSGPGNNNALAAKVVFVNGAGVATAYSLDDKQLHVTYTGKGSPVGPAILSIPGSQTTSVGTALVHENGNNPARITVTFSEAGSTYTATLQTS